MNNIASDLVDVKMKNSREPYIALDQNIEQELPPPREAIVLPKYDSLMLSLKNKSRFMDMAYYKRIFPRIPVGMVRPTILVNGFVAATWRKVAKKKAASIEVQPFKRITTKDKKAVEEQFSEYCKYGGFEASVRWVRGT